ncbi:MAG: FAD-dependent thymidylate synthase [Candidatus Bathyarchaeia archaeon]
MRVRLLTYIRSESLRDLVEFDELLPHLSFTYAIEGISRACSHQLVRHRVASFSQQSQRYVPLRRLQERVVEPDTISREASELFNKFIMEADEAYEALVKQGVPREDARFVLPNATETHLLMTMSGESLFHFFGLRCCNRAQWEIRRLADVMLDLAREVEPEIFEGAGPYCYQLGFCPEGRFSCGRVEEMRERYGESG